MGTSSLTRDSACVSSKAIGSRSEATWKAEWEERDAVERAARPWAARSFAVGCAAVAVMAVA
jgi:hypothetical protein